MKKIAKILVLVAICTMLSGCFFNDKTNNGMNTANSVNSVVSGR